MDVVASLQAYLQNNHSTFWKLLLADNADLWKKISSSSSTDGCTIFAVSDDSMEKTVGSTRLGQLQDVRNSEAAARMGEYHVVNECVTAEQLFDSGGVMTISGNVVPIERGVTGGLFGIGGQEDGSVTLGGRAKVVDSVFVQPNQVVHCVDDMVSPSALWRYCDQLRIPGSK